MDPVELQRMVDGERADAAALERMRERSLLRQAHEEASLPGVLASLQAHAWEATVRTTAGRTHHGPVVTAAADFCSLGARPGTVHLPYGGIASVRPAAGDHARRHDLLVDPDPTLSRDTFADLVARLAEERAQVRIGLLAGDPITGTLTTASADLVTVVGDDRRAPVTYVSLPAVVELSGLGSG